jgi:FAD/FMN-containing dehydrogenase
MKRREFCGMTLMGGAIAFAPVGRLLAEPDAEIHAIGLSGAEIILSRKAVADLQSGLRGTLYTSAQAGYDDARRIWNGMIDKRPALISACADVNDVVRAVNFARDNALLLAVRGGGHSFPGYSTCDGGMVIDLSAMHAVQADAKARVARVQGGAWVAHVDHPAQEHGLATTLGQISNTGVGGLTLGGGFGWLARRFGLACDNVLSVELVTADGKIRHVTAKDEPDLFWALRGGGGNYGVATAFEYRLHPVAPTVLAGHVVYPAAQVKDAIKFYVDQLTNAPRELSVDLALFPGKDQQPCAALYVCTTADSATGEKLLRPFRQFGKPIENTIGAMPYLAVQSQFDGPPLDPTMNYIKGGFVRAFPADLIDVLADDFRPSSQVSVFFQNANGAVADVAQSATAFSHRDALANLMVLGNWKDRSYNDKGRDEVRASWHMVERYTDGYYVNLNDADAAGTGRNYGANFQRLVALKKNYDPMNQFRLNANIKPV